MKKCLCFLLVLLSVAGIVSCSDDKPASLRVDGGEQFLSLDGLGRSGELTVTASAPWYVTKAEGVDWVTLSPESGPAGTARVRITLEANSGAARTAQLLFVSGETFAPFRVSQSAPGVGFDDADYYFYVTFGTLPTLYSGLHLLTHDKPTSVFYQRSSTFDAAQFPPRVTVLSGSSGIADDTQIDRMVADMKRRIREINTVDPTSVFGLYVDDLRCRVGYDWFVAQGIDSARVKVSMLSDGTATYQNFWDYFGNPASAEENWDRYAAQVEALDWDHGGRFPETRGLRDLDSYTWPYYLSTRPGYRLVLQDKNLLESSGAFMEAKLAQMNAQSIQPYQVLESLSSDGRQQFFRMAAFDYDRFAALFDASPKPNLVIIGTNASGIGVEVQQRNYVAKVVQLYGQQYDLFFKPHPADTSAADYEQRFGLKLLPGQMPFEIFLWALLDRIDLIGGYPSTVFLTVPTDKVGFVFAPDAASLVRPLNILLRDAPNVVWIQ